MLFAGPWAGKARQLQAGSAVIQGREYTHFSVLQLMTTEGLLVQEGHSQRVSVRVAADFLPANQPRTGHWSSSTYTVTITPGHNLLVSSQPTHAWGKQFRATCAAAAQSHLALYGDALGDASIASALGEQGSQALL